MAVDERELTLPAPIAWLLMPMALVALALLLATAAVFGTFILIVGLSLYFAVPFHSELIPVLPRRSRALAYVGMLAGAMAPLIALALLLNPVALNPFVYGWVALASGLLGLLLGLGGILLGRFWRLKQLRQIENLPTSNIGSVALGLAELRGSIAPRGRGPVLEEKWRFFPAIFLPPFWLSDETGRILVDPSTVPVRGLWPRAFGYRINDVVLTRNAIANRFGIPSRVALFEKDRVFVVGEVQSEPDPEQPGANRRVVRPATLKPGMLRESRHVFVLSDSSEAGAMRHLRRGIRRGSLLAMVWVAASLALVMQAAPKALGHYPSWTLSEMLDYAPKDERTQILVERYQSVPAERGVILRTLSDSVDPRFETALFETFADGLRNGSAEDKSASLRGLGKLRGLKAQAAPLLFEVLADATDLKHRDDAVRGLYAVSGSEGFGDPARELIDSLEKHPGDYCAGLREFRRRWWAHNLRDELAREMEHRCGERIPTQCERKCAGSAGERAQLCAEVCRLRAAEALEPERRNFLVDALANADLALEGEIVETLVAHEPATHREEYRSMLATGYAQRLASRYRSAAYFGVEVARAPELNPADLHDLDPKKRGAAVRASMQLLGSPNASEALRGVLLTALSDPDAEVRLTTVTRLAQTRHFLSDPQIQQQLGETLLDPEARVRVWAADALLKANRLSAELMPRLKAAAERGDPAIRERVAILMRRFVNQTGSGD